MLAEAIGKLETMVKLADVIKVKDVEKLRKVIVLLPGVDGEAAIHDYPPKSRCGKFHAFDDMVRAIGDDKICSDPEVYHTTDGIRVLIDRANRHEVITMPLLVSDRMKCVEKLRGGRTPKDLVNIFRFDLPGVGGDELIESIRKIDFKRKSDGKSTNEHGRETMGREVEALVQRAESIPKEITVSLPVFANVGLRDATLVSIKLGVYLDVEAEKIDVRPLADEIQLAYDRANIAVGVALKESLGEVPVYFGSPS